MKLQNFRIDPDLREKLESYCERTGANFSGAIRIAIKRLIEEENGKQPR